MHSCHGISTSTVWNVIDRVTPAILSLQRELVCWPKQPLRIASKFHDIAGFPCVAGCVDGTHVLVNPPAGDEDAYVNLHHTKSLNVAMVCGPDYSIYFCSSRCPGRWHDSRVLKESTLWTAFEENAQRPFPGAVILGDSAYSCNSWLIPLFRGDVEGLRVRSMERAAELIQCAAILHNICILFNDDGADLLDDEDLEIDEGESAEQDEGQEDR
ncbi:putative nuclease HARBI1 [Pocillopora verrucosa]|uniref:putative nuclease HARBI1 n=1 Tax=Pocillopora verrucosa TaxID=203993 RepID=UPI003341ADBD